MELAKRRGLCRALGTEAVASAAPAPRSAEAWEGAECPGTGDLGALPPCVTVGLGFLAVGNSEHMQALLPPGAKGKGARKSCPGSAGATWKGVW